MQPDTRFRVQARCLLTEAGCELLMLNDPRLTPLDQKLEEREQFYLKIHELKGRQKR